MINPMIALQLLLKAVGYVQAMRRGAADFVTKPWDNGLLLATLERCLEERRGAQSEMEIMDDNRTKVELLAQ